MSFRPRDLADRMAGRGQPDGYVRETFSLPREQARAKAKAFLRSYPKAAYMSEVERWRERDWQDPSFTVCDALETSDIHVFGDIFFRSEPVAVEAGKRPPKRR
jgi:hypothetical protein